MNHSPLLPQILILIGSTTLVATFFHYLKIPTIIGFILAGVVIGPFGLGLVNSVPGAEALTEIGVIFLMFTIGIEFSFRRLKRMKRSFFGLGLTQIIGTLLLSAILIKFILNFAWPKAFFIGGLISLSSTAIVMKLLQDSRETASPYGMSTIGILLCQDLAVIPMMLCLPLLAAANDIATPFSWVGVRMMAWKLIGVLILLGVGAKYIIPMLMEKIIKTRSRELFFFAMLLLCFGVAFTMDRIGLSLSFGAFLAGLMIAESPYGQQATADVVPLRDNFLGLFFASVGMLVDLKFMFLKFHWILVFVLSLFIIKSGLVYFFARLLKYPLSVALITGLLVFQVGEFSFILAEFGVKRSILSKSELQFFLSVSVITMMLTPILFDKAPKFVLSAGFRGLGKMPFADVPKGILRVILSNVDDELLPPRSISKSTQTKAAHTVIVGFGVAGQNLASVLKSLKIPFAVIEQNFEVVQDFQKKGVSISYGDASRIEVLEQAGIHTAKLVVVAVSGVQMTRAILHTVRKERPDVQVVIRTQYSRELEELGEFENAEVVVAEYETTIELLARTLSVYGISSDDIHKFMAQTRERLKGSTKSLSDSLRRSVDLPAWQAIGSIRPVRVRNGSTVSGKTLGEINLRAETGATVIAVFREEIGTAVPSGDFVFREGDVLHIIGDTECYEKVEKFLA